MPLESGQGREELSGGDVAGVDAHTGDEDLGQAGGVDPARIQGEAFGQVVERGRGAALRAQRGSRLVGVVAHVPQSSATPGGGSGAEGAVALARAMGLDTPGASGSAAVRSARGGRGPIAARSGRGSGPIPADRDRKSVV